MNLEMSTNKENKMKLKQGTAINFPAFSPEFITYLKKCNTKVASEIASALGTYVDHKLAEAVKKVRQAKQRSKGG